MRMIQSGKVTEEELAARFIYRCPHPACRESQRAYEFSGLFNHLHSRHHIIIPKADRAPFHGLTFDKLIEQFIDAQHKFAQVHSL